MPKVGVVNRLRMRIMQNLVEFPPHLIALHPPLMMAKLHQLSHIKQNMQVHLTEAFIASSSPEIEKFGAFSVLTASFSFCFKTSQRGDSYVNTMRTSKMIKTPIAMSAICQYVKPT